MQTSRDEKEKADAEFRRLVLELKVLLGPTPGGLHTAADARLLLLQEQMKEVRESVERADLIDRQIAARLNALATEWRYHQLRDEEERLRGELVDGLRPARERLRDLEDFRGSVEAVRHAVDVEFNAAVDRALPKVSQQLTHTFQRLTNHPAFDQLRVERADGPDKLVVRVGSTLATVPWSRPEDVLNQGAFTALGLVPHLVFSDLHAEQAELNVLIVDDPSQSFDTTHVELLLEELHRASAHAQLLLATHEEDRFRPVVERLFYAGCASQRLHPTRWTDA
jgi:hypothetical protein